MKRSTITNKRYYLKHLRTICRDLGYSLIDIKRMSDDDMLKIIEKDGRFPMEYFYALKKEAGL